MGQILANCRSATTKLVIMLYVLSNYNSSKNAFSQFSAMAPNYWWAVCMVNSWRLSDAYIRYWPGSSMIQVIACHLFGAKRLREPMMIPVNWIVRSEVQWTFYRNWKCYIYEIAFENVVYQRDGHLCLCFIVFNYGRRLYSSHRQMQDRSFNRITCKHFLSLSKHGDGNDNECGKHKAWMETRTLCKVNTVDRYFCIVQQQLFTSLITSKSAPML